jgi:hypothetical protein
MTEQTKPNFCVIGSSSGVPTLDDMLKLFEHLTGRDATPEEIAEARAVLDAEDYPAE